MTAHTRNGLGERTIEKRRGLLTDEVRRVSPTRPVRALNPGLALSNNEFLAPLVEQLAKDPLASAGADASRVTQLPGTTNLRGTFTARGQDMGRVLEELPFEAPTLERRIADPLDLGSGDAILLRAPGNPQIDEGVTLLHEMDHRGFDELEPFGLVPQVRMTGGEGFVEEDIIRLIDFKTGREKVDSLAWFKIRRGSTEKDVEAFANDPNFLLFLDQVLAARKKKRDATIGQLSAR